MPKAQKTKLFRELVPGDIFFWNGQKFQKLPLISRKNETLPDNAVELSYRQYALFGGRVQVKFIRHLDLEEKGTPTNVR